MASFTGGIYLGSRVNFNSSTFCYYYNPNNLYINPSSSVHNIVYTGYPYASIHWEKYNNSFDPDYTYSVQVRNLNVADNLKSNLTVFAYTPKNWTAVNDSSLKFSDSALWMYGNTPTIQTAYVNLDIYAYNNNSSSSVFVTSESFYISTYIYINDNYGNTNSSSSITLYVGETKNFGNLTSYYECSSVKQYGNSCVQESSGGSIKGVSAGSTTVVYNKKLKNGYIYVNNGSPTDSCSGTHTFTITVKAKSASSITQSNISKTYGEGAFTITPGRTGVSSLSWSLSQTGVVSLSATKGNSVTATIQGLGTVTVTLSGTAASGYNAPANKTFTITVSKGNTIVSLNKTSVTLWINHPSNSSSTTVTPTINGSSSTAYWNASNTNVTVTGSRTSGTITARNYGTSSVSFYVQGNDYYNTSETKTVSVTVYRYYSLTLLASINDIIIPKYYYVYATSSAIKVRLIVLDGAAQVMSLLSSSIQTSNGVVTNITSTIIDSTTIEYIITVNTSSNSYDEVKLGLLTAKYSGYQYFDSATITLYITRITLPTSKRIVTNNYLDILYNTTAPGDPNSPVSNAWCPTKSAIFNNIVVSNKYGRLIFNVIGTFADNQLIPQNSLYVVGCENDIYLKNNHIVPNIEYEDINLTRKFNIVITSNTTQYFYYGDPAVLSINYEVLLENSNTRVNVPMDIRVSGTITYTLTDVSPGKGNVSLTLSKDVNSSASFTLIPKYNYINSYTNTEYNLEYDTGICNYGDTKTVTVNSVYQKRSVSTTVYISSSSAGTSISASLSGKEATTSFTLYARVKENNTSSYLSISTSDFGVEFTTAYGSITNITTQSSNELKFTVKLNSETGSPQLTVNFKGKSNSTTNYISSSKQITINVIEKPTVSPIPVVYSVKYSNYNYSGANGNYITIYPSFTTYDSNGKLITTKVTGITASSSTPPSFGSLTVSSDSNFSTTGKYTISGTFTVGGNSYFDIYVTIPSGSSSYYASIPITISGY